MEYNSILKDVKSVLKQTGIPIETSIFSKKAPDEYLVITPISELFEHYADNQPQHEIQEARLSLFSKRNYMGRKNEVVGLLMVADFTLTGRRYVGFEQDTGFHHFSIDVAKSYEV